MNRRAVMAGKFERGGPALVGARFPARPTRRDQQSGFCKFSRAFEAAGKPVLQALVQFCQEPTSRVFHRLFVAPAFLSVPVFHASNKAWSRQYAVRKISASGA